MPVIALAAVLAGGATRIVQDQCGPFTDVTPGFCPYILEIYYLGITVGTSATTFSPDEPLTRGQGAVFVAKGINQTLARSSRRAALGQWWTPDANALTLSKLSLGDFLGFPQSDGQDVWVPVNTTGITRVRASDGKPLEGWNGAVNGYAALVAAGRVFMTGFLIPGRLYMVDPSQPPGAVTTVASNLGGEPGGLAFDGSRIWTADAQGSVSIVTPAPSLPWSVTTVSAGFSSPTGIVFDGSHIWVADLGLGALLQLDSGGAILQSIPTGPHPGFPIFDGENIWLPDAEAATVLVVRASTGQIVATLSGNGLSAPTSAAFDGERVLVAGNNLSLWRAADLSPLGFVTHATTGQLVGACSDGLRFWITYFDSGELLRF